MSKEIALFLCAFLTISSGSLIEPRDLAEQAQEQLEQLKSIVQGDINTAHNDLERMESDFQSNALDIYENAFAELEQENQTIYSQVDNLKELANSAGYDVSSCTNIREDVLDRLYVTYGSQIYTCYAIVYLEKAVIIVIDYNYVIDIEYTKVYELENQLRTCDGDLLCIETLLTQIESYKITIPQDIQKLLQSAESLLDEVKVFAQDCADTNISKYISDAGSIVRDIAACIDRIIG